MENNENQIQGDPAEIFLLDGETTEMLTDTPSDPRERKSNEQEPVATPVINTGTEAQPRVISTGPGQMTVQLENTHSPAGAYPMAHTFHPHHPFVPQPLAPPQPYIHQYQQPHNSYYASPQAPYKLEDSIASLRESIFKLVEKVNKLGDTVGYLEESNIKLKRTIEQFKEDNRKPLRVGYQLRCKEFIKWEFREHFLVESDDYRLHVFHANVKHDGISRHTLKTFCVSDASFITALDLKVTGNLNFCNQAFTVSNIAIISYNNTNEIFTRFRRYFQSVLTNHHKSKTSESLYSPIQSTDYINGTQVFTLSTMASSDPRVAVCYLKQA